MQAAVRIWNRGGKVCSQIYHLRLYGPNGFYRAFNGNATDPEVEVNLEFTLDGQVLIHLTNTDKHKAIQVTIKDNAYKQKDIFREKSKGGKAIVTLSLKDSFGWYDFSVQTIGFATFESRYTGRVETGKESFSAPFMGKVIK